MKDLGITKGDNRMIGLFLHNHPGTENNLDLDYDHVIVDKSDWSDVRHTVMKCGLLPSELLKQRDELLKALHEIMMLPESTGHAYKMKEIAESVITKTEER